MNNADIKTAEDFERIHKQQHTVYVDPYDSRDFLLAMHHPVEFPKKVDLRKYTPQVEYQGHINSCVANAGVNVLEILLYKANKFRDLSRMFLYWILREPYSNLRGKDNGSYPRDVFRQMSKHGICWEDIWPYDENKVNVKPSKEAYEDAKQKLIKEYRRIGELTQSPILRDRYGLTLAKVTLAKGFPVFISMRIGRQFYHIHGPLQDHDYDPVNVTNNRYVGLHAMCVVGYDDELGGFIVENSWGKNWGDNGFFLLKYDTAYSDIVDAWVCTKFWDISLPSEWERLGPQLTNYKTVKLRVNYYSDLDSKHRLKITSTVSGGVKPLKYYWKLWNGDPAYANEIEPIGDGKSVYVTIGKSTSKEKQWTYAVDVYDSGDPPFRVRQFIHVNVYYDKPKPKQIAIDADKIKTENNKKQSNIKDTQSHNNFKKVKPKPILRPKQKKRNYVWKSFHLIIKSLHIFLKYIRKNKR